MKKNVPAALSAELKNKTNQDTDWRLHKHADYQRVYKNSRKQFSARMVYFVAAHFPAAATQTQSEPGARVGITAGRVLGEAVERNRIKRRMRAAICAHYTLLPAGTDVVLHPKRSVLEVPWPELDGEVKRIFMHIRKTAGQSPGARRTRGSESTGSAAAQPSATELQV